MSRPLPSGHVLHSTNYCTFSPKSTFPKLKSGKVMVGKSEVKLLSHVNKMVHLYVPYVLAKTNLSEAKERKGQGWKTCTQHFVRKSQC